MNHVLSSIKIEYPFPNERLTMVLTLFNNDTFIYNDIQIFVLLISNSFYVEKGATCGDLEVEDSAFNIYLNYI